MLIRSCVKWSNSSRGQGHPRRLGLLTSARWISVSFLGCSRGVPPFDLWNPRVMTCRLGPDHHLRGTPPPLCPHLMTVHCWALPLLGGRIEGKPQLWVSPLVAVEGALPEEATLVVHHVSYEAGDDLAAEFHADGEHTDLENPLPSPLHSPCPPLPPPELLSLAAAAAGAPRRVAADHRRRRRCTPPPLLLPLSLFSSLSSLRWRDKMKLGIYGGYDMTYAAQRLTPGGPWILRDIRLGVQKWTPHFTPEENAIKSAAAWFRLPDLPVEFWDRDVLFSIASAIGRPVKVDTLTLEGSGRSFAKICVEI
ncbi:hypothetical protein Taro_049771 [Colocasia esculenta]|uniref:DUF4283 domain-containing protein n=1 Tax=Colocasia esculenta TaxID=4460 RepID=A0A843XC14_COLES|nr:hypothetical protein [Colocasia esculenta]